MREGRSELLIVDENNQNRLPWAGPPVRQLLCRLRARPHADAQRVGARALVLTRRHYSPAPSAAATTRKRSTFSMLTRSASAPGPSA